nr:BF3164 family lipoprotein [Aquiflexum sp. TKW24L]
MAFDDVEYVHEFPQTFTLEDGKTPEIDVIGIRDFRIFDSIMVMGTSNPDGIWFFISLPSYQKLGSFMKRGEGPLEFMQGPSTSNEASFVREHGRLLAFLYDFQKGKVKEFDISQSLNDGELDLTELEASLPPFLSNFIMVDSVTYFTKEIGNRDTQQLRFIYKKGEKTSLPLLDKLNQATLREGSDFNILATNTKFSNVQNRFVEAPTGLNYINIYSLDSTLAKTICIGKELSNISKIQEEWPQWDRKYVFINNQAFDDFFGVIYVNESFKDYETIKKQLPSIMLFDWEGNPLAELKMQNHFTNFDIDFKRQELYTFDAHSDEFLKFDIHDILISLKGQN